MKKVILIIVVIVLIVFGVYYLSSKNDSPNYSSSSNSSEPSPVSETAEVSIDIKDFSFNPSMLDIKAGTKVTWVNNDTVSHTVTSDSGDVLDSRTFSPGQSFSFTFTEPGSVSYHCALHPMMKGSITVRN